MLDSQEWRHKKTQTGQLAQVVWGEPERALDTRETGNGVYIYIYIHILLSLVS